MGRGGGGRGAPVGDTAAAPAAGEAQGAGNKRMRSDAFFPQTTGAAAQAAEGAAPMVGAAAGAAAGAAGEGDGAGEGQGDSSQPKKRIISLNKKA